MPLEMGQLRSIIKASPAPCSLIHFSHLLLLGKQVSAKPLLLLFLLQTEFKAQRNSQLLSHPFLLPSYSWEPGEFNALSSILSPNRVLSPLEPASYYCLCSMPASANHGRGKWGEHLPWDEVGPVRRWLVEFGLGSSWISPSGFHWALSR